MTCADRGVGRRDLDALGVLQQVGRQLADLVAEGGREQQALLGGGQQGQHLLHVVDEAHVEHAVGFVQHQDLDVRQVQVALLLQVEQAPGVATRTSSRLDAVDLRVHADAAEDHGGAQIEVLAVLAHRLLDLRGQLARGRQHQGANGAGARGGGWAAAAGARQSRRSCRCRSARRPAGRGLAARRGWPGPGRGGLRVALFEHGLEQGRCQVQIVKVHRMDAPCNAARLPGPIRRVPASQVGEKRVLLGMGALARDGP
jgi:hypothetical protein